MKRKLSMLLCAALAAGMLAGCGGVESLQRAGTHRQVRSR